MTDSEATIGTLAEAFTEVINEVDEEIGENRTYGAGIGPHDEDDQINALVEAVRDEGLFDATIATAKGDPSGVTYPNGQSADIVIEQDGKSTFCEAKLLRFQKANGQPYSREYSKVFNPFQDRNPRSFVHDVAKIAESEIRAEKTFLGMYYRPVNGAGTDITSEEIAEKFAADVTQWTDHSISVDTIGKFEGLQHPVHTRGAVITWTLDNQPEQYF